MYITLTSSQVFGHQQINHSFSYMYRIGRKTAHTASALIIGIQYLALARFATKIVVHTLLLIALVEMFKVTRIRDSHLERV